MALTFKRLSPKIWLVVMLLALGGVLALFEQRGIVTAPGPSPDTEEGEPDYYLEGATYTHFDAKGQPYQTLTSPRVSHLPADDITLARQPHVELVGKDQHIWQADGDSAEIGPNNDTLKLIGNAKLLEPTEGWQLETDVLHYDRRDAHAWSDSETRLSQHEQRMRGDSFDAWINEDRMILDGNVRGTLPPQ
ncbi:LPS export ABC transporter periplasmic protein LptC [Phytohalomonas tamaricis]|uniref:LPS export ABC transporter periplasmic protein LptC n=1 Tax=Phytohalomonas tamaricis TaxID=2081032 RepID=UPI000D0ADAEB|nr:LPS export ABC transporter periplasmic protein LptC [Phytohalomonas tamaricis]